MRRVAIAAFSLAALLSISPRSANAQFKLPPFFGRAIHGTLQPKDFVQGGADVASGVGAVAGGIAGPDGGPVTAIGGATAAYAAGQPIRDAAYGLGRLMDRMAPPTPAPAQPPVQQPPFYQPPVQQPAPQRLRFVYLDRNGKYGSFTQTNGNQWTNLDPSGVQYTFVEQGRGNGFVELRDFNRNLSVRLLTDGRTMLNMGQGWGFGTAGSGRFISY